MTETEQTRFRGTVWDKRLYAGMYVFYAALFSGLMLNPGKGGPGLRIAVAALICGMLWLGWRGRRLGLVTTNASGVCAHGYVRRRRWRWQDLDHLAVERMPVPYSGIAEVLVVYTRDGKRVPVRAINGSIRKLGPTWVADAVAVINGSIQSRGPNADRVR